MKVILIDESYPLNSRNTKILVSLEKSFPNAEIHVLSWDRENHFNGGESSLIYHLYSKRAKYGNKFQKLVGLFGYKRFCKLIITRLKPDLIIASHWNNLLMLPSVDYKKQMVIYENLDAPTGAWIGRSILNRIEFYYMKRIALTVHASRFYTYIYPEWFKQMVLENKPIFETTGVDYNPGQKLRVVYLGIIRYIDILKNLVDAVKDKHNIELYIHGDGPDYQELLEYTQNVSNVKCTGVYNNKDVEKIYQNADIIWAAYPNKDFNVKYAISNKFHESVAYGIPAIYSENTMLGQYAVNENLGYVVDPYSPTAIRHLIDELYTVKDSLMKIHESMTIHRKTVRSWDEDFLQLVKYIQEFQNNCQSPNAH